MQYQCNTTNQSQSSVDDMMHAGNGRYDQSDGGSVLPMTPRSNSDASSLLTTWTHSRRRRLHTDSSQMIDSSRDHPQQQVLDDTSQMIDRSCVIDSSRDRPQQQVLDDTSQQWPPVNDTSPDNIRIEQRHNSIDSRTVSPLRSSDRWCEAGTQSCSVDCSETSSTTVDSMDHDDDQLMFHDPVILFSYVTDSFRELDDIMNRVRLSFVVCRCSCILPPSGLKRSVGY